MKTLMLAVVTAAVVSAGAAPDVKVEFWRDDVVRILNLAHQNDGNWPWNLKI